MGNDWFHEYFINELKAIGRKPTSNMQHEVVDSLPSSGNEQTIYFVKSDSGSSNNRYDEYVWISSSNTFEKIGSTQIDGSTTQPDWNQNDATQPDYVKNRPFYTGDLVETVLVEETTATFSDEGGIYAAEVTSTFLATVGETYKVSWDGTTYESVCIEYRAGLFAIGNLSIAGAGADTGEPFVIVPNGSSIFIYTPDTSGTHTFSISGLTAEVVKIPDKYVSDTFRTIVTAGNPLEWSEDEWATYYGLYQGGKLLKINEIRTSQNESYVLSMFYNARAKIANITTTSSTGDMYFLSTNSYTNERYWSPVFADTRLYLHYIQTGSASDPWLREEYDALCMSDGLTLMTKKANENPVIRKVVLAGDKEIVLSSSTANSAKKFKITVDDTGTLSATEVT